MPLYTEDTNFWLYKTNTDTISTIDKYNQGEYTKIVLNPEYSDEKNKYRHDSTNIFCFPKEEKIKKGDYIFIFNDIKKGKIIKGFIKHYRVSSDCKLNKKYSVFKDSLLHKYFVTFDIEYLYDEPFNIIKFKDNFHDETPDVKTPTMFNKLYTKDNMFNFKELSKDLGVFLLNLILRKVKKKQIEIKKSSSSKSSSSKSDESDNSDAESDNSDAESDIADNESDDNSDNSDNESDDSDNESDDNSDNSDNSDNESDNNSDESKSDEEKIDYFEDNKKTKGYMIPVLVKVCDKIIKKIKDLIKKNKDIKPTLFTEHYLDCGECDSIDNNNIGLKYSYLKSKNKKETFEALDFNDIEEQYEAYQNMQSYEMDKTPSKPTFNIVFIKDNSSEYNNYILIYWFLI